MATPRQPVSFRERILFQFRTSDNLRYLDASFRRTLPPDDPRLKFILGTLADTVDEFGSTYGQGGALIDTDPLAQRGSAFRSGNVVEELQHLNRAFYHERLRTSSQLLNTRPLPGGHGEFDVGSREPLFYQMFVADSLRPPGLENLNGPGPLHALHEDQSFSSLFRAPDQVGFSDNYNPSIGVEDMPWSAGLASRSAETAISEYYGDESPFDTHLAHASQNGDEFYADVHLRDHGDDGFTSSPFSVLEAASRAAVVPRQLPDGRQRAPMPITQMEMAELSARGGRKQSVSGFENYFYSRRTPVPVADPSMVSGAAGRFERREGIPFWQKTGHRPELYTGRWQSATEQSAFGPVDGDAGDVEETLGTGSSEFGGERLGHVRRWDMSRLRNPQANQHRLFGPTSY